MEIRAAGLGVAQQFGMAVRYNGAVVGEYVADLLVKTVRALEDVHRIQCVNYLRATDLRLCLLLNFGTPRLGIKRVVLGS
jgi:GxxExxY protein